MKKYLAMAAVSAMILSCFAACGSDDSSSSSTASTTGASTEASTADATDETTEGTTEETAEKTTEKKTEAETEEDTTEEDTTEDETEETTEKTTKEKTTKEKPSRTASGPVDFTGKWACSEMVYDGESMTTFPMLDIPLDVMLQVEIFEDGNITIGTGLTGLGDEDSTSTGKWEAVDEDTIKVSGFKTNGEEDDDSPFKDNQEIDFTDDSFSFTADDDGQEVEVKFTRVDEFSTYDISSLMGGLEEAVSGMSSELASSATK